jgi:hypothetical protein
LPDKPEIEVIVQEKKEDRTAAQNSLMWLWITLITEEWEGWEKNDVHEYFKKTHLVPIYERDEPEFAAMINAVRKVYTDGHQVEAKTMEKHIVRMTSTTGATKEQFTEYLKDIEKDMISRGIPLPHPEDRYYSAMGIKQ